MPFEKIAKNKYVSPSGRKYNAAQVRLYYSGTQPGFRPSDEGKPNSDKRKPNSDKRTNYAAGLRR
jgi:hypothetical protein